MASFKVTLMHLQKFGRIAASQNLWNRQMSSLDNLSNSVSDSISASIVPVKTTVAVLPEHTWNDVSGHYQFLLDSVQVSSGLPWWAVLIGTGVVVRSSLVPFNILYEKKLIRNLPHLAALGKIQREIQACHKRGDHVGILTKQGEIKYYKKSNNFSWKKSANWFLLPAALAMSLNFFSIRNLAEISYQPLHETSFLWLPSLCQNDPYFLLPAINAAATAYVFKYGIDTSSDNPIAQLLSSNKALLFTTVFMGSIQSMFPSALVLYWLASNLYGIVIVKPLMNNDKFRTKLGLLSLDDKKEAMKVLPNLQDVVGSANENYQAARESGHSLDMEARKVKLAQLDKKGGDIEHVDVEELKENIERLNQELKIKSDELNKLQKETENQLQFLKKSEEIWNIENDSSKIEKAK